jgi:hypothetical protein
MRLLRHNRCGGAAATTASATKLESAFGRYATAVIRISGADGLTTGIRGGFVE